MSQTLVIFPHQLFAQHPGLAEEPDRVLLVEDNLFFGDPHHPLRLHQQKLWLHRASMTRYAARLRSEGWELSYCEHRTEGGTLKAALQSLSAGERVLVADPHDDLLEKRLRRHAASLSLELVWLPTPMFLNSREDNQRYRAGKKRWFMADFYKHQRRRLDVLMEEGQPAGGQWSYDKDNRKKVPKRMLRAIPPVWTPQHDRIDEQARAHILERYPEHWGSLEQLIYPSDHEQAEQWLERFLSERFALFGDYEDAMVEGEGQLWHGVLTPMLNIGLLTPAQVIDAALETAQREQVPLNSVEGFVRQIIGWREFMRATYEELGGVMRTRNHWEHRRPLSPRFYEANTGIPPIDDILRRLLRTGYCHHIERLMALGGFLFLCETDPDDIYRWFMELFVDSYDWVMVPNVYAMSQHADGGLITTKPYFSGSSYIRKMSNYPGGEWTAVWDGLYWRWILKHADALARNPRWAMMCSMARKMDPQKQAEHLRQADRYLATL